MWTNRMIRTKKERRKGGNLQKRINNYKSDLKDNFLGSRHIYSWLEKGGEGGARDLGRGFVLVFSV